MEEPFQWKTVDVHSFLANTSFANGQKLAGRAMSFVTTNTPDDPRRRGVVVSTVPPAFQVTVLSSLEAHGFLHFGWVRLGVGPVKVHPESGAELTLDRPSDAEEFVRLAAAGLRWLKIDIDRETYQIQIDTKPRLPGIKSEITFSTPVVNMSNEDVLKQLKMFLEITLIDTDIHDARNLPRLVADIAVSAQLEEATLGFDRDIGGLTSD